MIRIVGVRFQKAGKIYYFDPFEFELETGMHVIVETARGVEMGTVLIPPKDVEEEKVIQPLKPVLRVATDEDEKIVERNREKEKEALVICKEKIAKHGLDMKLVNVEYTFDNNKLLFYFTADGRIDFRELVKDLAAVFRTRIELRQIGVRDETKILGGIGICGRPLCCKTYLADFVPVSIKMAKEQNLSLNPTKISGVCGRLMCCLKNEQETYEYLNSRLPSVGDIVTTKDGSKGEVQSVNVLRQLVKVVVDNGNEKELQEYPVKELWFRPKKRKDVKLTEEELKELEGLEDDGIIEEKPEKTHRYDKKRLRENYETKEHQKEVKTTKENRDMKESSQLPEEQEGKEIRSFEKGENKEKPDFKEKQDHKERSDWKEKRDYKEKNEFREKRDYKERNEFKEKRDYKEKNECKEKREYKDTNDSREKRDYRDKSEWKEKREYKEKRDWKDNQEEKTEYEYKSKRDYRSYNASVEELEETAYERPYKKRYDGKGKRYFGKNRKKRDYHSGE